MDIPFTMKMLLIFAMLSLVGLTIVSNINTKIQVSDQFTNYSKSFYSDYVDNSYWAMDYGFLLLLIGFLAITVIFASKIPTDSIFFIMSIIYIIFIWIISVTLSYFWKTISTGSSYFAPILPNIPIIDFIMTNLLYVCLCYTTLIVIVLYVKE